MTAKKKRKLPTTAALLNREIERLRAVLEKTLRSERILGTCVQQIANGNHPNPTAAAIYAYRELWPDTTDVPEISGIERTVNELGAAVGKMAAYDIDEKLIAVHIYARGEEAAEVLRVVEELEASWDEKKDGAA